MLLGLFVMKVSIIIPIYNVANEIERCLLSVIAQDYKNIELVLVNDCTLDDSFILAKKLLKKQRHTKQVLYLEHKYNRGLSAARNTGIDAATGTYLFFLDSDDELGNVSTISHLVEIMKSNPNEYDIVFGGYSSINKDGVFDEKRYSDTVYESNLEIREAYSFHGILAMAWGKLINKKYVKQNNLYFKEGIYHEDMLWSYLTYSNASRVCGTSDIVYKYYYRDSSIMATIKKKNASDLCEIAIDVYKDAIKANKIKDRTTIVILEIYRRNALKALFLFDDREFLYEKINYLKRIKLPILATKKFSLIKMNFLLKLPTFYIMFFLKLKTRLKYK